MSLLTKLLPPYGSSNDDSYEPRSEQISPFEAPIRGVDIVQGHFAVITENGTYFYEPAGSFQSEYAWPSIEEAEDYLARKNLKGATNEEHPEPEKRIVNESENPEYDSDEGPAKTETVEVGE